MNTMRQKMAGFLLVALATTMVSAAPPVRNVVLLFSGYVQGNYAPCG